MSNEPAKLGMAVVSRESIATLKQFGLAAETMGMQRIANGAALSTFEINQRVKERIAELIESSETLEDAAKLATALAHIEKAEATVFKNMGNSIQPERPQRNGKRFAKLSPSNPIDVSPAS